MWFAQVPVVRMSHYPKRVSTLPRLELLFEISEQKEKASEPKASGLSLPMNATAPPRAYFCCMLLR